MTRCYCCDKALSDYEATLRHAETKEFLDTCVKCLKGLSIPAVGREDLVGRQEEVEGLDDSFNDDLGPMWIEEEE